MTTSVAFGPLRANVVKVVGLVRLLDIHSRGIHPLDESLAIGVWQLTMSQYSTDFEFPDPKALSNERHDTGAGLKAACKGEDSSNFPLWTFSLNSSASDVTPSWAHLLRINNSKLKQMDRRASHT